MGNRRGNFCHRMGLAERPRSIGSSMRQENRGGDRASLVRSSRAPDARQPPLRVPVTATLASRTKGNEMRPSTQEKPRSRYAHGLLAASALFACLSSCSRSSNSAPGANADAGTTAQSAAPALQLAGRWNAVGMGTCDSIDIHSQGNRFCDVYMEFSESGISCGHGWYLGRYGENTEGGLHRNFYTARLDYVAGSILDSATTRRARVSFDNRMIEDVTVEKTAGGQIVVSLRNVDGGSHFESQCEGTFAPAH